MSEAPERMIMQPCSVYGWGHPDRVRQIGSWGVEYVRADLTTDPMTDPRVKALVEVLEWYAEQSRLARLIHSEGDVGRHAIQMDGGSKARAAIAAMKGGE